MKSRSDMSYRDPADLLSHPQNSRRHSARQIEKIVESIKQFGFTRPVLINPDNVILAGHGAVQAAQQAGLCSVPVRVLNLTPEQERAYVIADNRLALDSEWDFDQLRAEMKYLLSAGIETSLTGFDWSEVASLLQEASPTPPSPERSGNGSRGAPIGDAEIDELPSRYAVLVELDDERTQVALLKRLIAEGYQVRGLGA